MQEIKHGVFFFFSFCTSHLVNIAKMSKGEVGLVNDPSPMRKYFSLLNGKNNCTRVPWLGDDKKNGNEKQASGQTGGKFKEFFFNLALFKSY